MHLKRVLLAAVMVLAGVSHAWAALPPNYQRVAELQAILNDPAVVETFRIDQPIDRIEIIKTDLYRITAGSCHVDVAIVDVPVEEGLVGPRQFKIKIVDRVCPD